jgi:GalNAc5-diNAcBac-PP-undecaprenol beta-1,3-glucosyltransferase
MKNAPSISIIMATFNRAHFIAETLLSIQTQNYSDWECIIIDDGSTDDTSEVVNPFLKDSRFNYLRRPETFKKGLPGCRNYGLDIAEGNFFVFLDDDDIFHPDLLKISANILGESNLDYCRYQRTTFTGCFNYQFNFEEDYDVIHLGIKDLEDIITNRIPFNSCQVLWKRSCFKSRRFNEELMYAEEWELYSRILMDGLKGISIEKVLLFARKHEKSNTGEYRLNDPVRKSSMKLAIKLVFQELRNKKLLSQLLKKFFIQAAFNMKDYKLLRFILNTGGFQEYKIWTYKLIYKFYPLIRPLFQVKSKL